MSKSKKEEPAAEDTEKKDAEAVDSAPKKGKKKLLFIAGGSGVVIIIAAVLFLTGMLGGGAKEANKEEHNPEEAAAQKALDTEASKPVYYELPEFLVNLNSTTNRASFIKMSVTLELRDKSGVVTMDANKPRIQDIFNTYLRELRPADVQGSEGIYRLRTELLARLNSMIEDGAVKDILFGEIIIQ